MNTDKIYAEQIANEYSKKQNTKVKALKRLDAKVKNTPNIFAFTWGICFCLIFGVGMCLVMGVLGSGSIVSIGLGIGVGCVGILGMSVCYSLFKKILESEKEKYAEDIIRLANEIVNEE